MELPGLNDPDDKHDINKGFQINKEYAIKYTTFKEKQELDSLKQKYGNVDACEASEDNSSSSESEDEDAEALTPKIEEQFLKTLSMIRQKNPVIYNKDTKFFEGSGSSSPDEDEENQNRTKVKKQSVYIKDYERRRLMEKGVKAFVSDSEDDSDGEDKAKIKTYAEEQEDLKKSFSQAYEEFDNNADDNDLLQKREKTENEKVIEEADYKTWLKQTGLSQNDATKNPMDALRRFWNDPGLNESEKFLRDYILERKFVDKDNDVIPSYDDIVLEEEDEEEEQKQEIFERKFNFRYEEPDEEFIKSFPRTIKGSVRRTDDKRAKKRKERETRKKEEKEKRKQELRQLKNLKRKEIMQKIEKLKEITGNDSIGFMEEDIDGDFDPKKYDDLMQKVFNDDYYVEEEETKPQFDDEDDEQDGDWDSWNAESERYGEYYEEGDTGEPHLDDPNFNMDADYDPENEPQLSKRQRKKSRLAQALSNRKPIYNPDDKTFEEYFDEYYKLDYEDIIGDLPVRFKYRDVTPNSYGLTTSEILNCEDTELNKWCSLKRAIRYNTKDEEAADRRRFNKKAKNQTKKLQILTSLTDQEENEPGPTSLRGQTRQRNVPLASKFTKSKILPGSFGKTKYLHNLQGRRKVDKKARKAKLDILRRLKDADKRQTAKIPVDRLAAYGITRKKKS